MRFDEAEALFVSSVKQMRQIVLPAVDSLPHKINPNDPQLAREALHEWAHAACGVVGFDFGPRAEDQSEACRLRQRTKAAPPASNTPDAHVPGSGTPGSAD